MAALRGNNLSNVKKQNEASIRLAIFKYAPISRSEIAEMLSLTPPTITTNVAQLIKDGLVHEVTVAPGAEEEHGVGRKPVLIDFVPGCRYAVGVELGPYETSLCLVGLHGQTVESSILPAAPDDYDEMLETVAASIDALVQKSGVDKTKIVGAGIGVPGFVEAARGVLRTGARTGWMGHSIAEDFARRLGMPVRIENNARLRAIGEELFAPEARPDTFAYFLISRGIACPLIIRNRLYAGNNAGAGEVGHMVMQRDGAECKTCGNRGCLEAIASEQAILDRCKEALKAGVNTLLADICTDAEQLTMGDILKAQQMGDRIVSGILQDAVTYLGIALANIINFISPEMVVVDGYIMKSPQNRELFLQTCKMNLFALNSSEVKIEFVEFDRMRGARGAAAFAVNEFFLKQQNEG